MKRLPSAEIERQGEDIFARQVAPALSTPTASRFVAIDVESGDFEVADSERGAIYSLRRRHPDSQIWLRKTDTIVSKTIGGRFSP